MFKQVKLNDAILKFYQRSQPIAFSNAETLYDDLVLLRDQILMYGDLSEAQTNYLNNFIEKFDTTLSTTVRDIFEKWLNDGFLVDFIRDIINEEVIEARGGKPTLKDRLDETTAQLVDIATEVNDIFINVKTYGAKGDGVTDDRQAIQNAIDSVGAKGGIVYFPPTNAFYSIGSVNPADTLNIFTITKPIKFLGGQNPLSKSGETNPNIKLSDSFPMVVESVFFLNSNQISFENIYIHCGDVLKAKRGLYSNTFISRCDFTNTTISHASVCCWDLQLYLSSLTNCNAYYTDGKGFYLHGSDTAQGTSLTLNTCYAMDCGTGYHLYNLTYSNFSSLACDNSDLAYYIQFCNSVTLSGIGAERCTRIIELFRANNSSLNGLQVIGRPTVNTNVSGVIKTVNGGTNNFTISGVNVSTYLLEELYFTNLLHITSSSSLGFTILDSSVTREKTTDESSDGITYRFAISEIVSPTFENGWSGSLQLYRSSNNIVMIKGTLKVGEVVNTTVGTVEEFKSSHPSVFGGYKVGGTGQKIFNNFAITGNTLVCADDSSLVTGDTVYINHMYYI